MTIYRTPMNDAGRLALLRTAYERGNSDGDGNTPHLTTATLNAIQTLAADFETALRDLTQLNGQRATVTESARVHAKELSYRVQEARRALRANLQLGRLPRAALRFYPLSIEGRLDTSHRRNAWLPLADALLTGDDAAQAAGLPALPNRQELAASFAASKAAEESVNLITGAFLAARANLQTLRNLVDEQIRDLTRELRFNLAKRPLPHQRDIMRTYGLRFRSETRAETDEEPQEDAMPVAEAVRELAIV